MSMLAERKIKQKWSLNPRGKFWSEDPNKFGQKMLEKMGWSHGRGLGAKEDGIVEHVKVSYKHDSKGMGYKESDNQWTEHDSNFNALLQSLSGQVNSENDIKLSSLEEKSEKSKARLHYKKFTRGKDLSRCSDKDLANIFGKKSLKEPPQQPSPKTELENEKPSTDGFSHNGGSMVDYFKKKLPGFGKSNGYVVGKNGVLKKESESEEENYTGFGFNGFLKRESDSEAKNNCNRSGFKHKSSLEIPNGTPKKIKVEEVNSNGLSNPAFDPLFGTVEVQKHVLNTIEEEENDEVETEIENKKKKRSTNVEECQDVVNANKEKKQDQENNVSVINNSNFEDTEQGHWHINDTFEIKKKNKDLQIDGCQGIEDSEIKPKKKKKKNANSLDSSKFEDNNSENMEVKMNENSLNLAFDNPSFVDGNCQNSHISENFEIKRKKKKKEKAVIENGDDSSNSISGDFEIKRKKKKKNENSLDYSKFEYNSENMEVKMNENSLNLAFDNPNFVDGNCQNSHIGENFEIKRKKKKKEKGDDSSNSISGDFEIKRKKKKKNKETTAIDNPNFEEGDGNDQNSYVNEEFEIKRKKKNKGFVAVDNLNFLEGDGIDQGSYVNDEFEVKRKKKKKETIPIDNPNFGDDGNDHSGYVNEELGRKRKRKKEESMNLAIDNPIFQDDGCQDSSYVNDDFEIKRKKKKKRKENDSFALDNPNFNLSGISDTVKNEESSSLMEVTGNTTEEISCDLILNVTSTPYVEKEIPKSSLKRRKSVRFSSVTEARIIPNNDDMKRDELFEINSLVIADSMNNEVSDLEEISKKIDGFQAEIENDINEAKICKYIGDVGNHDGENEMLPEGTKLKFKNAKFGKSPIWLKKYNMSKSKSSYKHLIKGDIILGFKNTNLHEINGYAVSDNSR